MRLGRQWNGLGGGEGTDTARGLIFQSEPQIYKKLEVVYVIVIARGQEFMAVNRPESEGEARGQGQFTLP